MTGGDLDGDGRIDLMGVTGNHPSNIYCQNLSTPGNIDFGLRTYLLFLRHRLLQRHHHRRP